MAYRSHTSNTGVSNTPSVSVPTGVQAGDIVLLKCTFDHTDAVFDDADWPSGFTELYDGNNTFHGHSYGVAWKRLTGSDSGTYQLGAVYSSSQEWVCEAIAFSGRHAINNPEITSNVNNSSNNSPETVLATNITAINGDDIVFMGFGDGIPRGNGLAFSQATNFIERTDIVYEGNQTTTQTRDNVSAGSIGASSSMTFSPGTAAWTALLVRIPMAGIHATSGTPTAQSATLAGTASSKTTRSATGALAAQAASVAGTARRLRTYFVTGTPAAQAASVAGTAKNFSIRTASGALAAQAGSFAGTAAHLRRHTTSAVLNAAAAVLAGTGARQGVPQIARPVSDVVTANWTDQNGGTTNLYQQVNEVTPDHTDYVRTSVANDPLELRYGSVLDPKTPVNHVIRYYLKGNGTADAVVTLKQGAATVATWTELNVPVVETLYEHTLTGPQADSITDYTNLRLEVIAT